MFTEDTAGLRANPQSIGLLGMEVLRRFRVIFDYSRSRIYLDSNRSFAEPFVYDVNGLKLRANGPSFSPPHVASVRDASPGSEAGIEVSDVVLEIDGKSTSGLSLEKIRKMLGRPGETHKLTISRKEKTLKTVLRTRELLN